MTDRLENELQQELGPCIVCGDPVTPVDESELPENRMFNEGPYMHAGCGW